MKQDEIIEMARQVYGIDKWNVGQFKRLEAFGKLVAEKEREACAKLVDYWEAREGEHADAIRARGQA